MISDSASDDEYVIVHGGLNLGDLDDEWFVSTTDSEGDCLFEIHKTVSYGAES